MIYGSVSGKDYASDLVSWVEPDNFSLLDDDIEVYSDEVEVEVGTEFPDALLIKRASVEATNDLLYNNHIYDVFSNALATPPEQDPIANQQIRDIVKELPLFRKVEDIWVALIAGRAPIIDAGDKYSSFIGTIDARDLCERVIRSIFRAGTTGGVVSVKDGKISFSLIPSRCLKIYRASYDLSSQYVYRVSSVGDGQLQFTYYFDDGTVLTKLHDYIGNSIGELQHTGVVKQTTSQFVMFTDPGKYTEPFYAGLYSSACAVIRSFQTLMRLEERLREMIRELPESALTQSKNGSGETMVRLQGALVISDTVEHPVRSSYLIPDVPIDKAVTAYKIALKQFANDAMLSDVFFDIEKAGGGGAMSAKAIEALMYPAKIYATKLQSLLAEGIKKVVKSAIINSFGDKNVEVSIRWPDTFTVDNADRIATISSRIGTTLTAEEALAEIEHITLAEARARLFDNRDTLHEVESDDTEVEVESDGTGVDVEDMKVLSATKSDVKKTCGLPIYPDGWNAPIPHNSKVIMDYMYFGEPPMGTPFPKQNEGGVTSGKEQNPEQGTEHE